MTRLTPSLLSSGSEIRYLNSESAVVLAAAWQRMNRQADAVRLLKRVAAWLDGPDAPRWPQWRIARAEVHALLGEREAALDSLDQAFAAGYRGVTAPLLTYKMPYRGEDNVLFENIRNDPRFAAWYVRMHAEVARQLTQAKQEEAAGKDSRPPASQSSM
jgi:hypothetical protein